MTLGPINTEGGSAIVGAGANTRVAFWTGANTLSSSANFTWAANVLTVTGDVSVSNLLEVKGTLQLDNGGVASALLYSTGANAFRYADSTNVGGLNYALSTTSTTISTRTLNSASIIFNNQTFTPGAAHKAVQIVNAWATENFAHSSLYLYGRQNGANTQQLIGLNLAMEKATAATTLNQMIGIFVASPTVDGTVTSSRVMSISDQTNANITTPRGIVFSNTGPANSIVWGNGAIQYAPIANTVRFTESTVTGGLDLKFTTTSTTINTVTTDIAGIIFQNQTFTAGALHSSVSITPTWTAEDQSHLGLSITATQNGANSSALTGLNLALVKATGATTLSSAFGLNIDAISVTGTLTSASGVRIGNQSAAGGTSAFGINILSQTANATTTRAIEIAGTSVNNAVRLGSSANIYGNGANVINISDATDARSLVLTLSAAGNQTIGTSAGSLVFNVAGTDEAILTATNFQPNANDGNALGVSGTAWSDLFLASGAVIDFNAGDITITHSANNLAFAGSSGATLGYSFNNNVIVGTTVAGASAVSTVALSNSATAPSASADLCHLYSVDNSAGHATLGVYSEETVAADVALASTHSYTVQINGTKYKIMLVAA